MVFGEECERPIRPVTMEAALHTGAADMEYGRTLRTKKMEDGEVGTWGLKGVWSWKDTGTTIILYGNCGK